MTIKVLNYQTGNKSSLFYSVFATVVCLAVQTFCGSVHAQYQAAGRQLVPILEEIVVAGTEDHPRNDHQTIFPLSDGRLLMAWTEYYSAGVVDSSPTHIVSKISTDQGRTWGESSILQENIWAENVKYPNFVRLPSDEILFFFRGWDSSSQAAVYMKRSQDEAETWSEMVQISEPGVYWNNADHVITLSTGRVILPAFGVVGGGPYEDSSTQLESFVYYSDDGFQTWHKSQTMTAPGRGAHEPSVVELNDGRLLCFMRTRLGSVYQAISMDWGVTWSEPEPTVLSAPGSPSQLKRIPQTGDLLAVWNNAEFPVGNNPRTPLTAAISKDEGETWTNYQDIVASPDIASYSSVFFQDDEAIVMAGIGSGRPDISEWIYKVDEFYVTPPPPPPPPPPSCVLSTVAYWRFEGNNGSAVADGATVPTTGTPIRDEIGGNHAVSTGSGVTWQGDDAGELFGVAIPNPDPLDSSINGTRNTGGANARSLFFDDSTACLTIADSDALDFSGAFTLEGYFRAAHTTVVHVVLNKRDQSSTIGYKVFLDAAGVLHFGVDNGPMWGRVGFDDQILNDGTWHHFAAIRDARDYLHIWVDGVEDITPETNGIAKISGDLSNDAPLLIGSDERTAETSMYGYIDELRFSNVALSPALFLLNDAEYLPGDANYDGFVNEVDAAILSANWQTTGASWGHGDFNKDGNVDDLDVTILAVNWQVTPGTATASEPASCVMIVIGLLTSILLLRTRKKRRATDGK